MQEGHSLVEGQVPALGLADRLVEGVQPVGVQPVEVVAVAGMSAP